jgi:hypothetical protein
MTVRVPSSSYHYANSSQDHCERDGSRHRDAVGSDGRGGHAGVSGRRDHVPAGAGKVGLVTPRPSQPHGYQQMPPATAADAEPTHASIPTVTVATAVAVTRQRSIVEPTFHFLGSKETPS